MQKSSDQKQVDAFIDNLVDGVVERYAKDINFIILFGSAAKGQFVKGASDIDLVIQLKKQNKVEEVKEYSTDLFWKLDKKHKLGFESYLANAKAKTFAESFFRQIENNLNLYTPLFVYGPKDLNWEEGKVVRPEWILPANLIVSIGTAFLKFKKEGKVLWGRNIKPEIKVDLSWWERWKGICIPVYLSTASLFILFVFPKQAVKYSIKSVLWGIESALVYMNKLVSKKEKQIERLKKLSALKFDVVSINQVVQLHFSLKYHLITKKEFEIVNSAIKNKREGFEGGIKDAFIFVWNTFVFIIKLNFVAILKGVTRG
jgi:predicted nucleotidyltransferase